jgi:hypothetical protein
VGLSSSITFLNFQTQYAGHGILIFSSNQRRATLNSSQLTRHLGLKRFILSSSYSSNLDTNCGRGSEGEAEVAVREQLLEIETVHRFEAVVFAEAFVAFAVLYKFVEALGFAYDEFEHLFLRLLEGADLGFEVFEGLGEERVTLGAELLLAGLWVELVVFQQDAQCPCATLCPRLLSYPKVIA